MVKPERSEVDFDCHQLTVWDAISIAQVDEIVRDAHLPLEVETAIYRAWWKCRLHHRMLELDG
jgi:uncharacterized protein (UPF0147 family)